MSNAIVFRMASGIPGDLSRRGSETVEEAVLNSSLPFSVFGIPGKIVSGKFVPLVANDVAASIWGMYVRPYPTTGGNASGTTPPASGIGDVMRRGYMTVLNLAGTPAKGGQVYVRVANISGSKIIGGIEAASEYATTTGTAGSNTGNGTIGTLSAVLPAKTGNYAVTMTGATAFTVDDPDGIKLKNGATGSAYSDRGVTFTITVGNTPMIAGDSFTVVVLANTVAIPGTFFESAADASGNVEIAYNI